MINHEKLNLIIKKFLEDKQHNYNILNLESVLQLVSLIHKIPINSSYKVCDEFVPLNESINNTSNFFYSIDPIYSVRFHNILNEINLYNGVDYTSVKFNKYPKSYFNKNRSEVAQDGFVFIDYTETIDDSFTICHEITHKFSYQKNTISLLKHFFGEVSTILVEFLMEDYLLNNTNYSKEEVLVHRNNRLISVKRDSEAIIVENGLIELYKDNKINSYDIVKYFDKLNIDCLKYIKNILDKSSLQLHIRQRYVLGMLLSSFMYDIIEKENSFKTLEDLIYILGKDNNSIKDDVVKLKKFIPILDNDKLMVNSKILGDIEESYLKQVDKVKVNSKKLDDIEDVYLRKLDKIKIKK